MNIKDIMCKKSMMLDYTNRKIEVIFRVVDMELSKQLLEKLDYIDSPVFDECGFVVKIAIQQIPEVIIYLSENNIAIYAVIPKTNKQ